ncbi:MAG: holo-[acyl-carrier-protein] synthase [Chloroflexi bacterium RBG_16_50_9]|nr:MAG: holo-[acyl-carrier-protein] synthase [Chloroflexi bacterium RBG_16_50_9]
MHTVGVDIIEIDRIRAAIDRWGERFLNRIYTQLELKLCRRRTGPLASRFAGKEAVMKALGTGLRGVGWREIEITSESSGKPLVQLYGKAQDKAASLGLGTLAISLSDSKEYAVAVVVSETN